MTEDLSIFDPQHGVGFAGKKITARTMLIDPACYII